MFDAISCILVIKARSTMLMKHDSLDSTFIRMYGSHNWLKVVVLLLSVTYYQFSPILSPYFRSPLHAIIIMFVVFGVGYVSLTH